MGDDFSNHQVFSADNASQRHTQIVSELRAYLIGHGFTEVTRPANGDRRIAIGPAGRWTCVYDSYGNGDFPNHEEFRSLSLHLSRIAPVVDIHMDDSWSVQFFLYRDGARADQVAKDLSIFHSWADDEERNQYLGKPEVWSEFFQAPGQTERLRKIWQGADNAGAILSGTAAIVGWNPRLCEVGYTIDYDGIPIYYRDHIDDLAATSDFIEYYYSFSDMP